MALNSPAATAVGTPSSIWVLFTYEYLGLCKCREQTAAYGQTCIDRCWGGGGGQFLPVNESTVMKSEGRHKKKEEGTRE